MSDDIVTDLARERGYSDKDIAAGRDAALRQQRLAHPQGRFDEAGCFFLTERRACCAGLRRPSPRRPHIEMMHGRSLTHVATLHDIPILHVRRLARAFAMACACTAETHHAKAQLLVRLQHVLKPVAPRRDPSR